MFLVVNLFSIVVFVLIAYLLSNNRKAIQWRSVSVVLGLEMLLAWLFTQFSAGRAAVLWAANAFNWLVSAASKGIAFAFPEWLTSNHGGPNFVTAALLPMLLVVPLFDILAYFRFLPWVIKWVGQGLSKITGQPKFEAFFSIEMMFLGNTEVLAVSKAQLQQLSARRNMTLAMMSMSCVSAAIIGSYTQMVPSEYVLTAIPLNILGAIAVSALLNPTPVAPEDDVIVQVEGESGAREPFFSFIGGSILGAGKMVLIIAATVIAFVSLGELINQILGLSVFLTSFANFGTIGMIVACFKGLVNQEKNDYIAARVPEMLLAGVLVSLLSSAMAGLFVW